MSTGVVSKPHQAIGVSGMGKLAAWAELAKLRINSMILLTVALAAYLAGSDPLALWPIVHVVVGVFFVAASGSAVNQYLERHSDRLMERTRTRPLPDHRLLPGEVAMLAAVTLGIGEAYLATLVGWPAALAGLATWTLYAWVYTPLKSVTWLNTYVGAVAGAMPILIGALAVSQKVPAVAWWFFAALFLWQFPHFMAIAWLYRDDYRSGGLRMVSVGDRDGQWTRWHAVVFASAMIPVSVAATVASGATAAVAAGTAGLLSVGYLALAVRLARQLNNSTARQLLFGSLVYLPLLMLVLFVVRIGAGL